MKTGAWITLLLVILLFFFSCQKEKERCAATISIRLNDRAEDMEWMEVEAGRLDPAGRIMINATGYNDERFLLNLQNITDTGIITNLTIEQLFCTDGLGFSAAGIQAGFIRIKERSATYLSGSFEVFFESANDAARVVKGEGNFSLYGHD